MNVMWIVKHSASATVICNDFVPVNVTVVTEIFTSWHNITHVGSNSN